MGAGCGTGLNHAVVLVGYTDEDDGSTPAPQPDPTPDPSPSPTPDPAVGECEVYKWWHTCKDSSNGLVCKRTRTVTTTTGRSKTLGEPTGATKVSFSSRLPRALASAA